MLAPTDIPSPARPGGDPGIPPKTLAFPAGAHAIGGTKNSSAPRDVVLGWIPEHLDAASEAAFEAP